MHCATKMIARCMQTLCVYNYTKNLQGSLWEQQQYIDEFTI